MSWSELNLSWVAGGALAVMAALAHSVIGEQKIFRRLTQGADAGEILRDPVLQRLFQLFWHFPSVVWAGLGAAAIAAGLGAEEARPAVHSGAAFLALSGLANLMVTRRIHPGGVTLLLAAALLFAGTVSKS